MTAAHPPLRYCGDAGGQTSAGQPCRNTLGLGADGRCPTHSTDSVERAKVPPPRNPPRLVITTVPPEALPPEALDSLDGVAAWLVWVIQAVARGEIDARTANEMTRALKELRPVLLHVGYERRLKAYERAIRLWKESGSTDHLFALLAGEGLK